MCLQVKFEAAVAQQGELQRQLDSERRQSEARERREGAEPECRLSSGALFVGMSLPGACRARVSAGSRTTIPRAHRGAWTCAQPHFERPASTRGWVLCLHACLATSLGGGVGVLWPHPCVLQYDPGAHGYTLEPRAWRHARAAVTCWRGLRRTRGRVRRSGGRKQLRIRHASRGGTPALKVRPVAGVGPPIPRTWLPHCSAVNGQLHRCGLPLGGPAGRSRLGSRNWRRGSRRSDGRLLLQCRMRRLPRRREIQRRSEPPHKVIKRDAARCVVGCEGKRARELAPWLHVQSSGG